MAEDHPLLLELIEICKNHNICEGKAHLAFELYLELCEVYKLWDVDHHFNKDMKIFFFTGKPRKNDENNIYVPITTDNSLSPEYIERLQMYLSPSNKSLVLVFKDGDSTSTYYRVTQGLVKPDSPETASRKKNEEKKFLQFQKELQKNKNKLFAFAMKNEKQSSS